MTPPLFQFGQIHPDYAVPVVNERAVRASAGILFFLAMIAFMNAFLLGNFQPTRVFVVVFLMDFGIRLFTNPLYAPSMVVGQWVVRHQRPDYVGAPQKRFAWGIGFALALLMLYLMVLNNVVGPINMLVCSVCLMLMFFEAAFGICVGCKLYNAFNKDKAQLCPGGVCEVPTEQAPSVGLAQMAVVLVFAGLSVFVAQAIYRQGGPNTPHAASASVVPSGPAPANAADATRCQVPAYAKALGHEDKWKQHNNCP
jgi:hypothetical protein